MPGSTDTAWRPVFYTSRALTKTEQNYSKVEGESLGVLTGILTNKRYLYGRHFDVIVDHQPLVSLYNVKKEAPVRVAKHKSKLRSFSFTVKYEPGKSNPSDYGSRHPPPEKGYSKQQRDELGVEDEEEDREIIVN